MRDSGSPANSSDPDGTLFLGDGSARSEVAVRNYRVLRKLGEGGMGEVWEAQQLSPIRRRVALKVIKQGMDTKQTIGRFQSERQALALMDHPNIARVYDAGATEGGRPYFAMEYVDGIPITDFCELRRLDLEQRLRLFMTVCDGVQHAHQKGIIHRDLKPSNLLVKIQQDQWVVKIIDFGIAKATSQRLTDTTFYTQLGAWVGTPEYMSPEQAEMTGLDVDTRTDVYSLGVLLYELLTGARAFDATEAMKIGLDEIRRRIREDDPLKPSSRVEVLERETRSQSDAPTTSSLDHSVLKRQLRGDLDWIVMKALEKDRTRRYGSPAELAADIGRYLADEPVTAGPPGTAYRTRKFVRRHRFAVIAATFALGALVVGTVGASVGLLRARASEERAKQEAETAERVSQLLIDLFEISDPSEARGTSVTAREILDTGAARIGQQLQEEPLVRASLLSTIGNVYRQLGLYDQAEPMLEDALETRERLLPAGDPDIADSLVDLAELSIRQGRFAEAEVNYKRALDLQRAAFGENSLAEAATLNGLGWLYRRQDRVSEAEPLFEKALEVREATLGPLHPDTATTLDNLGTIRRHQARLDEAESLFTRALASREATLGPDHPDVALTLNRLGMIEYERGNMTQARWYFERALDIRERVLGEDHPDVARTLQPLSGTYVRQGRFAEGLEIFERALALQEAALGPDHPEVGQTLEVMAGNLRNLGQFDLAEQYMLRGLSILERAWGPVHSLVATAVSNLGTLYRRQGRFRDAEPYLRRSLEIQREIFGAEHPRTAQSFAHLGDLYQDSGDFQRAEEYHLRALAVRETHADGQALAATLASLGRLYVDSGRLDEAEKALEQALALKRESMGSGHPGLAITLTDLGVYYTARGLYREAENAHREALEILQRTVGPRHYSVGRARLDYSQLLLAVGRTREARQELTDALSILESSFGPDHPLTTSARGQLSELSAA